MTNDDTEMKAPAFSVVRGDTSPEELAALTVLLAALRRGRGRPHAPEQQTVAGGWKSYWHMMSHGLIPGREAWRSTFRR